MCARRRLKSTCASAQSDQSLRCPHKKVSILDYPKCAERRFYSDCANAQADLNLRWAHTSIGTLFHIESPCDMRLLSASLVLLSNYPAGEEIELPFLLTGSWPIKLTRGDLLWFIDQILDDITTFLSWHGHRHTYTKTDLSRMRIALSQASPDIHIAITEPLMFAW